MQFLQQQPTQPTSLYPSINEVLRKGPPYAQVIPPTQGGYWAQGFHNDSAYLKTNPADLKPINTALTCRIQRDDVTTAYRQHFLEKVNICVMFASDL